jgi:hypothetical protein
MRLRLRLLRAFPALFVVSFFALLVLGCRK